MTININYKGAFFEQANITPIRCEPVFETLRKLWNKIKSDAKSVYSNRKGGAHGHLGLVLTYSQYSLISPTPFVYPTHPGPLIITDGTTAHENSNMRIAHTEELRLFREVTGVEQALVQQIVSTVEESYLADTCNRTTNSINNTVAVILVHIQDNYSQLMPHKLLEREDIVKKNIYNSRDLIATALSVVMELLKFSDITGTFYTQLQVFNISYIIVHRTSKFGLVICEWNCMQYRKLGCDSNSFFEHLTEG